MTTAATAQSTDSTMPAMAIPRPLPYCLAFLTPTMPQTSAITAPPMMPKISDTIAHQLVFGGGAE